VTGRWVRRVATVLWNCVSCPVRPPQVAAHGWVRRVVADVALLAVAGAWGLTFPLGKRVLEVMPPFTYLTLRFAMAAAVLLVWQRGRLRAAAGWTLDFGIAADDRLIHAAAADLAQRLPPAERQHWIEHVVAPPVSRNFLTMRLGAGSCIDDGEIRDW